MQETKLISMRVPVDLLENIDSLWRHDRALSRSYIIFNLLNAIFDAADPATLFIMSMWQLRKKKGYQLSLTYKPEESTESDLRTKNLITP